MNLAEKIKIPNNKIAASKSQYNLDRETDKMSSLASGILGKYEYLTSQNIAPKPGAIELGKFTKQIKLKTKQKQKQLKTKDIWMKMKVKMSMNRSICR